MFQDVSYSGRFTFSVVLHQCCSFGYFASQQVSKSGDNKCCGFCSAFISRLKDFPLLSLKIGRKCFIHMNTRLHTLDICYLTKHAVLFVTSVLSERAIKIHPQVHFANTNYKTRTAQNVITFTFSNNNNFLLSEDFFFHFGWKYWWILFQLLSFICIFISYLYLYL